jgi:hypothetical protein
VIYIYIALSQGCIKEAWIVLVEIIKTIYQYVYNTEYILIIWKLHRNCISIFYLYISELHQGGPDRPRRDHVRPPQPRHAEPGYNTYNTIIVVIVIFSSYVLYCILVDAVRPPQPQHAEPGYDFIIKAKIVVIC